MAEIITAKTAGFCFGVRKAVDQAFALAEEGAGRLYTYGPVIHNDEVVRRLEAKGVVTLKSEAELLTLCGAAEDAAAEAQASQAKPQSADATVFPAKPQSTDVAALPEKPQSADVTALPVKPQSADATAFPAKPPQQDAPPRVILRSHGVPKRIIDLLETKGIAYADVACPFVKRIHNIVYEKSADHNIVIIGDPTHPEVEGIRGWCRREASVLQTEAEAEQYQPPEQLPVCVVAQTTFHLNNFQKIVAILEKRVYDVNIVNTICNATAQHQSEAREIAGTADAMIVIGDTKSSNSRKLYEICREACENTFFIQTVEDLHFPEGASYQRIGITAGASTPDHIIEEVQKHVGRVF